MLQDTADHRASGTGPQFAFSTPAHQDYFYIRETDEFRMIWIPLMDLTLANGGLAIAVGSEKHGLIDHVELPGVFSTGFKGRPQKGVPEDQVEGVWSANGVSMGDGVDMTTGGVGTG